MNADDDSDDEVSGHDIEIVRKASVELMKHFDSVQIFASRHEGQKTIAVKSGLGNWFSRFGQISLWVKAQVAIDSKEEIDREEAE